MPDNNNLIELKAGDLLCANGEDVNNLYVVIKGRISAYATYGKFTFSSGAVACISGGYYGICVYNYIAEEDSIVERFPYSSISDIVKICTKYRNDSGHIVMIHNRFIMELIRTYLSLLISCRKKDSAYTIDTRVNKWELDKFNGISGIPADISEKYFASNPYVAAAAMAEGARFANVLNDACLQMAEFLGINKDYIPPAEEPAPVAAAVHEDTDDGYHDEDILAELKGSLAMILAYADTYEEEADEFTGLINQLKSCPDKLSTNEDTRRLRKDISTMFYRIYYDVFMHSLNDESIPNYINMFLNFGYMDEELLGDAATVSLYKISRRIGVTCSNSHVFTIYDWLKHIIWGEREPSRNHLDQDYSEYIREQFRTGQLKGSEAEHLGDNDAKLRFEIENMFSQTHRMTYGKVSSFIPILIAENVYKPLEQMLMSSEQIMDSINAVRKLDFSLFFRSTVYSNEKLGISKEYVYTEILPDIILIPCIGSHGVMWQEIEGRNRNSSARFMLPIFCYSPVIPTITGVLGKYRWEMCKRIQGAYWNSISEKSLTSEYCDYLQFYKKNRELPDSAREKIRSSLANCRNNFCDVFCKDYEQWINYESKGSGKLNKISRLILAKYCPFNSDIRLELKGNPMYTDAIEYYERTLSISRRRLDNIIKALTAKELNIPRELRETRAYYCR